ncbi:Universal stress protein A protein [Spatholobus suberectus]|nr:Universal stress protein A protein [Spatholobus suberectus]
MEKEQKGSEKKVMVVIDENEHSYHALIWVLDNLKDLVTKSSLIVFATQPLPSISIASPHPGSAGLFNPLGTDQELIMSILRRNRSISEGLCEKAKNVCASRGVFIEAITEAGEPKEIICNEVFKHGIDLLVMPHCHSCPLKRVFVESLSEYCLRKANCPVLLVQNPAEQKRFGDILRIYLCGDDNNDGDDGDNADGDGCGGADSNDCGGTGGDRGNASVMVVAKLVLVVTLPMVVAIALVVVIVVVVVAVAVMMVMVMKLVVVEAMLVVVVIVAAVMGGSCDNGDGGGGGDASGGGGGGCGDGGSSSGGGDSGGDNGDGCGGGGGDGKKCYCQI